MFATKGFSLVCSELSVLLVCAAHWVVALSPHRLSVDSRQRGDPFSFNPGRSAAFCMDFVLLCCDGLVWWLIFIVAVSR